ncbi:MAG TPA: efflux RND transporter periplasmic adaptor subunit [Terriglobales bacterium]|nr:efflux RND transporter periplasmic adaptor subunit [Terriglobales bacterium]
MKVEEEDTVERPPVVTQERPVIQQPPQHSRRNWLVALLAFALIAGIVISGILPRVKARTALCKDTSEMAVPSVLIVHPKRTAASDEIVLPANVQPYISAPIYARTNGYLRRWYTDIGAHVKKGQLLAEIETPELDQQLQQARANLSTAEANLNLAQITAQRYEGLLKSDSVSKQETDNAVGAYAANKAVVDADRANVRQLEALQSFEKIYAPFDGIITARNTDIGALISAGSTGGASTELFQIAQPSKLRVYVSVPEAYSQGAKPGLSADLVLSEFPGRRFPGKLVRTASAIDQTTRTLLVEIAVENPTATLLSGAYAEVHMKIPGASSSYTIPVNTLLFRSEGLRVASVVGEKAALLPISIGHDYGAEVEVVAGLTGDESLIVNPPDSLLPGQAVRVAQQSSPDQANGGK